MDQKKFDRLIPAGVEGARGMVTSEQMRAARAMLRMEQTELADAAGLSVHTIKRLEAMSGPIEARMATVRRLAEALEARGIIFLDDADAPGLRLQRKPAAKGRRKKR